MSKLKPVACYLIIIAVTFIVFYNSLQGEFVFDDESVIVTNSSLQSLSNIPKFFTADEGFHKVIGRYYRPVVSSSYTIDYAIWGLNPFGFHLTNVIIHIIACLLLFKIFTTLFWRYKYKYFYSLFAVLFFAVHPIHTEAVSWISGRTDSMVTMFFIGAFLCYLEFTKEQDHLHEKNSHHKESKKYPWLLLTIVLYILGLLTKEMIVTFPLIILAYDFIYRKKDIKYFKENILVYLLFAVVTIIYLILRYSLLSGIPERESYNYFYNKTSETTIGTMLKTIPVYFRLLLAPFKLLYHYNGVIPDTVVFYEKDVILSVVFILFFLALAVYYYKKDSIISFCIIFFFVSLLPVMNFIPTMNLMAERFLYFTSFSLALLVCYLLMKGSVRRDYKILIVGFLIIICSLSYLTHLRNFDWINNNDLFLSASGVNGTVILVNEANIYANTKRYNDAAPMYKKAIDIRDNNLLAHHNLGLIYLLRGHLDSAEMKFKKGISLDSLAPDGYFQMATVYNMKANKDSAIYMLEKLQQVSPNYKESAGILENLKSGNPIDTELLKEQLGDKEFTGNQINMLQRRSYKYFMEEKYEDAIKDLEQLIMLNKDSSTISGYMNNIAMCYEKMSMPEKEEEYFLKAINLDENNINAYNGLAGFYLRTGNKDKGKEYLKKVLLLKPDDEGAKRKLDSLNRE